MFSHSHSAFHQYRRHFDNALKALELKIAERHASAFRLFEGRFDARFDAALKKIDDRFAANDARRACDREEDGARFERIERQIDGLQKSNGDMLNESKSLKRTTILTGIGTVTTIVFGVAGINSAMIANMHASFDAGKVTAEAVAELRAVSRDADVPGPLPDSKMTFR